MTSKILFLDDRWQEENWKESFDEWLPDSVEAVYEQYGYKAIQRLRENPEVKLVFLDLHFEGQPEQGEEILTKIKEHYPELRIIILTSINDIQLALRLVHQEKRAYYYFYKHSIDPDQLRKLIENAIETFDLRAEVIRKTDIGMIVGEAGPLREVLRLTERASEVDSSVLITGESGTGKELVARSIHQNSRRRNKPFVAVNCGAIAENLIESELFGHVRGAFTNAIMDKRGKFERAHRGTVFLDEIAELKPELQVPLLRVLQLGEFEKVGSETVQKVDVRVIAATNNNIEQRVKEGRFRGDLFYRLNVIRIDVPPLRSRREDIPALAAYFLQRLCDRFGDTKDLSPEGLQWLCQQDWPGNIRQLENVLESAVVTSESDTIGVQDLRPSAEPAGGSPSAASVEEWVGRIVSGPAGWEDVRREYAASGDMRGKIVAGVLTSLRQQLRRRPTGPDLGAALKIDPNYARQILLNLRLHLKDF